MNERVAKVIAENQHQSWLYDERTCSLCDPKKLDTAREFLLKAARAAVAIVIEDCAQIAEYELTSFPDGDKNAEWLIERIAHLIRSAPEDSKAHSELEKLALT